MLQEWVKLNLWITNFKFHMWRWRKWKMQTLYKKDWQCDVYNSEVLEELHSHSRGGRACSPGPTLSPSPPPPLCLPSTRWPPSRTLYGTGCVCRTGWHAAPPYCGTVQGKELCHYLFDIKSFKPLGKKRSIYSLCRMNCLLWSKKKKFSFIIVTE